MAAIKEKPDMGRIEVIAPDQRFRRWTPADVLLTHCYARTTVLLNRRLAEPGRMRGNRKRAAGS